MDPRLLFIRSLLLGTVFVSSLSALVEEVVWVRMLAVVFGSTAAAQAAVVAAFMIGLAVGSAWLGSHADQTPARSILRYGAIEMALGILVILMPWVLRPSFDGLAPRGALLSVALALPDPAALPAIVAFLGRTALASSALLLPTVLMGATLPFAVRLWGSPTGTGGAPALYAANAIGAAVGACLAGIRLLPPVSWLAPSPPDLAGGPAGLIGIYGMTMSNTFAGLSHVCLAYILWIGRGIAFPIRLPDGHPDAAPPAQRSDGGIPALPEALPGAGLLAIAAFSGFAALALETLWTRALALPFKGFTWTFSSVLVFWLLSTGLGSAAAGARIGAPSLFGLGGASFAIAATAFGRAPLSGALEGLALAGLLHLLILFARRRTPRAAMGLLLLAAGLVSACSILVLDHLQALGALASREAAAPELLAALGKASFLVLALPAALFGSLLPIALLAAGPSRPGASTGRVWSANGLGAAIGAIAAPAILVPALGLQGSILAIAAILGSTGGILALTSGLPGRLSASLAAGAAILSLSLSAATAPFNNGIRFVPGLFEDGTPAVFERPATANRIVRASEGTEGLAVAVENPDFAYRALYTDGFSATDTRPEGHYMRMAGHLPALYADRTRRAFVLGLGTGLTADALSKHPFESIEISEISPSVRDVLPAFDPWNGGLSRRIDSPPFHVLFDDARHRLLRSPPGAYDVIASEPLPPYFAGSVHVYTRDFFRLAKSRLAPGGRLAQWAPAHLLGPEDFRILVRSFADVFPESSIWFFRESCLLLGRADDRAPDDARAAARIRSSPKVAQALGEIGLERPADVLSARLLQGNALRAFAGEGARMTDNHPILEFSVLNRRAPEGGAMAANLRSLAAAAARQASPTEGLSPEDARALERSLAARAFVLEAAALDHAGSYEPALERLAKARAADPDARSIADREDETFARSRLKEGQTLFANGRKDALGALEGVAARRPGWPGALALLGEVRLKLGPPTAAFILAQRAIRAAIDPRHPLPEALDLRERARAMLPGEPPEVPAEEKKAPGTGGTIPSKGTAVDDLLHPLRGRTPEERRAYYAAYLDTETYEKAVESGLSDPDDRIRLLVSQLIEERMKGPKRERLEIALRKAAADPRPTLSAEAARVLALIGDATGVPALIRGLSSPDPALRQSCAEALGRLRPDAAFEPLQSRIRDRDWRVQVRSIESASAYRRKETIPLLIEVCDSPDEFVRASAFQSLDSLTNIPSVPSVARLPSDERLREARDLKAWWTKWWAEKGEAFRLPEPPESRPAPAPEPAPPKPPPAAPAAPPDGDPPR